MIQYEETKDKLNKQIKDNINKLSQMKVSYNNKIELYETCQKNISMLLGRYYIEDKEYLETLLKNAEDGLEYFNGQIAKIDEIYKTLNSIKKEILANAKKNKDRNSDKIVNILYVGRLYKDGSNRINLVYGFDDQKTLSNNQKMEQTENGFEIEINAKNYKAINFCFSNERDMWDDNSSENYTFSISSKMSKFVNPDKYVIVARSEENKIKAEIEKYNEEYKNIKNNFFNNSIYEENTMMKYIETQMKLVEQNNIEECERASRTKDNGTLLISEIKGKVLLPYTGEEVEEIFEKNQFKYKNIENVIEKNFIRPLTDYRDLYGARWRETFKLLTEREEYTKLEATELAVELLNKRYLHPAIISACKNLDELDVYLDCLDKNELDDFKIFDIKYELYPIVVKENRPFARIGFVKRVYDILRKVFSKKRNKYNEIDVVDKFSMF